MDSISRCSLFPENFSITRSGVDGNRNMEIVTRRRNDLIPVHSRTLFRSRPSKNDPGSNPWNEILNAQAANGSLAWTPIPGTHVCPVSCFLSNCFGFKPFPFHSTASCFVTTWLAPSSLLGPLPSLSRPSSSLFFSTLLFFFPFSLKNRTCLCTWRTYEATINSFTSLPNRWRH